MNRSFGPWSTAIHTGAASQLNTFWKRRLAMLPSLSHTASRASRRTILFLGVLTVAAFALPTLKWGDHGSFGSAALQVVADEFDPPDSTNSGAENGEGKVARNGDPKSTGIPEFLPRPSKEEEEILAALQRPLTVNFVDLPLEDCFQFISDQGKIDVYLDRATLQEEGVPLDQPIKLKIKGRRLEAVLNLLLRPLQLTFVIEDDVLTITTTSKAADKLITRTYPVRDLYQAPSNDVDDSAPKNAQTDATPSPVKFVLYQGFGGGSTENAGGRGGGPRRLRYSGLEKAILNSIGTDDDWTDNGGKGSITYVASSGSLVIRQTRAIHAEILELLRALRAAKRAGYSETVKPRKDEGK